MSKQDKLMYSVLFAVCGVLFLAGSGMDRFFGNLIAMLNGNDYSLIAIIIFGGALLTMLYTVGKLVFSSSKSDKTKKVTKKVIPHCQSYMTYEEIKKIHFSKFDFSVPERENLEKDGLNISELIPVAVVEPFILDEEEEIDEEEHEVNEEIQKYRMQISEADKVTADLSEYNTLLDGQVNFQVDPELFNWKAENEQLLAKYNQSEKVIIGGTYTPESMKVVGKENWDGTPSTSEESAQEPSENRKPSKNPLEDENSLFYYKPKNKKIENTAHQEGTTSDNSNPNSEEMNSEEKESNPVMGQFLGSDFFGDLEAATEEINAENQDYTETNNEALKNIATTPPDKLDVDDLMNEGKNDINTDDLEEGAE